MCETVSRFCIFIVWTVCISVECLEYSYTPIYGNRNESRCYDDFNRPQRCIPEFENAAFSLDFKATNTCGENGEQEYCVQTGITAIRKACEICYPGEHDARFLTDTHNVDNLTWWQSETMLEGIQYPNQVNLTLNFGKAFDVTYVRLWFMSPRPESFYLSKKTAKGGPWIPWQYYSATCRDTYGLPDQSYTMKGEETRALCTSEYSDISPLRGGNVAFGTLEFRPSAYYFDSSPDLQEWVTATEVMITLDRLNTFGDEVFGDPQVLKSYFYAIADVSVGARCKCNGHASECISSSDPGGFQRKVCKCEHNTAGADCEECLPFYNDLPWKRATAKNAYECQECNCNGFSNRCMFDAKLYEQTGHGGHCLDCMSNRDGPNCERCKPNYYMREDGYCTACECNEIGSRNLQCSGEGKCQCKPGVIGEKCDRCAPNHYDFSFSGCKSCHCDKSGSYNNEPRCDPVSGICYCKENVEGRQCNECKPGFFSLDPVNRFGCTPCFCYGHSSKCDSAMGYFKYFIESTFAKSSERWTAEDFKRNSVQIKFESISQSIGVQATGSEAIYFVAPDRFLGDQRNSYNQILEFSLRTGDTRYIASATDIILEGSGMVITNTIFAQKNSLPSMETQNYKFRLHEHSDYGWSPKQTSRSFIALLSNLTAIKIRGTYSPIGVGFLDNFKLETASRGTAGQPALWIESCECPEGYIGQYCESCAPGFRHNPAFGGSFMDCIPCDCNGHASICDSETGRCICQHHTSGENCELCARGFYGNALAGTSSDCMLCDCPNSGPCIQIGENAVMCTECPTGYSGHKCDTCADGFFGDPLGIFGPSRPCQVCDCNGNIDVNAIGNCDTITGICLKCIYFTSGASCRQCLPGYYGDALTLPKGDCRKCDCYEPGVEDDNGEKPICDQTTGACRCKPNVIGNSCDQCLDGYFNIDSGEGCHSCNCDPIGSFNQSCNVHTGQCLCRPGVTGLRCDHCEIRKYGFSLEGCTNCNCDEMGSKHLQCDVTGQCPCLENVEGRQCNQCRENKYDRQRGCIDCPDCYSLVQNAAKNHSKNLKELQNILDEIERRPTVITETEFSDELTQLENDIYEFQDKIKSTTKDDGLFAQLKHIEEKEKDISRLLSEVDENSFLATERKQIAELNLDHTDQIILDIEYALEEAESDFNQQSKMALEEAWERSKVIGQQSQKMAQIAQEARELADYLDGKSIDLTSKAKEEKTQSIDAHNKAKNITATQQIVFGESIRINGEIHSAKVKLTKTKNWAKDVASEAKQVKDDALALLNEVNNIVTPRVDTNQFKSKSNDMKSEAYRLRNETEKLLSHAQTTKDSINEKNMIGKELLENVKEQQEELNDFNNDIIFFDSQATQAINSWNDILGSAEANYKLLLDFDNEAQKSKQEAETALETISEIEEILENVNTSTIDAQNNLRDTQAISNKALEKAFQANQLARNSSRIATKIKNDAEDLFHNTTFLSDEAGLMFDRVVNTEGELKNLLDLARSNYSLVNEAKEKVGRAGKDTSSASKRVTDLLNDVEAIILELQNSPDITDDDIDRLEEDLRILEDRLRDTKIEEKLEELQKEQRMQNNLIEQYKDQIKLLEKEVLNVEEIVNALPEGCYTDHQLEP